jgi:hypothetical protein
MTAGASALDGRIMVQDDRQRVHMKKDLTLLGLVAAWALACSSSSTTPATTSTTTTPTTTSTSVPAIYQKFQSSVAVTVEGGQVVLRSNGLPDHPSPYWGVGNALYEAPSPGMTLAPNTIASQNFTMRVPLAPAIATASDTPLGPIGMAVNGVALFNQYAAGRSPLGAEILTFDRYNGHPQQTGQYHYHIEPLWLTGRNGASSFIGVLLDGFPVYGPRESDGSLPTGLDSCNGHTHATPDFSAGIYHYHVTATTPYIAGCFKGAAGTVG